MVTETQEDELPIRWICDLNLALQVPPTDRSSLRAGRLTCDSWFILGWRWQKTALLQGLSQISTHLVHIRIFRVSKGGNKGVFFRNIFILLSCLYYKPLSKSPNKTLTNEVWVKKCWQIVLSLLASILTDELCSLELEQPLHSSAIISLYPNRV